MTRHPARATVAAIVALAVAAALVAGCGADEDASTGTRLTVAPTAVGAPVGPTTSMPPTTPAPPTTIAPTTTSTVPAPPRTFSMAATGDFLLHLPVQAQALTYGGGATYDFGPMLADVAPELTAADLAICHMETPLSADDTSLSGYPMFNAPREIASAARAAGYDGCSTASNHSLDRGLTGVAATLDVLDAAGLGHAGTARSAEEAAAPPIYDVVSDDGRPVRVGHLSYAYGFNGIPVPPEAPWSANLIDPARIATDAAALRARGAEVVAVSLQWGAEYQAQPTAEQQAIAAQLLAGPDVDVILGSHVHVVQPVQRVGGKVVVYGLGNLLSNQTERPATQDGVVIHLDLVEGTDHRFSVGAIRYTPTRVEVPGHVIRRVSPTSDPASFQRTTQALGLLGGFDGTATTGGP